MPTAVTVPSAPTVATAGSLEVQVTAELVPETMSRQVSPSLPRVKSSRFRERLAPEELGGVDVVVVGGVVADDEAPPES